MADKDKAQPIIIKKVNKGGGGHHGGAWKVAYADFVTAMMAFFLVMWLVGTLPEESLSGISEYFKNPSVLSGTSRTPPPNALGAGGAGTNPVKVSKNMTSPTMGGEGPKVGEGESPRDAEEAKEVARQLEQQKLESLLAELKDAIETSESLAQFKDQLLLDITPEGLRIQIVDQQNRPMFDVGSSRLKDYTTEILRELSPYMNKVENRISITGHTDQSRYASPSGYSNWELSADRANAARRALVAAGLSEEKLSRVVGLSSSVLFDKENPTNPINRRISIIVMSQAAEEAARMSEDGDAALQAPDAAVPGSEDAFPGATDADGNPAPPITPISLPKPPQAR